MEKTLIISGKPVQFKCTGAFLLHFKRLTGKDPIKSIVDMEKILKKGNKEKDILEKISISDIELLYEIVWVLAKTADKEVPDMLDWIDSFDEFPIGEIIKELIVLIRSAFSSTLKIENKDDKKKVTENLSLLKV